MLNLGAGGGGDSSLCIGGGGGSNAPGSIYAGGGSELFTLNLSRKFCTGGGGAPENTS